MSLYIGTNYHPHDWPEERWAEDIARMKEAGFTTVRLGHLCWDSFEPDEGVYTFEWFDRVMDLVHEAGLGVVLDVSMHPAPIWVHSLCRGCNLGGKNGDLQNPVRRYMEDVSDPAYQFYALRFAQVLVDRYKDHPALFAFGLCNELGAGRMSWSEESRQRWIDWLRKKYKTVEALNRAWATQRWSRKLRSFDEVFFPVNEADTGAPEAWLDMRRFFSDGVGEFITKLEQTVKERAPQIPTTSNHYAEYRLLGFDYMKYCDRFVEYPGVGFYFDYQAEDGWTVNPAMSHRLAETGKPMWCIEFQTGSFGLHHGRPGLLRMVMLASLLQRTQMILGWTWRSMLGGEEQFYTGMLDHDGEPNVNFEIYRQVASEFKKLENYGFPYLPTPRIGVAHSYDADWAVQYPGNIMFMQSYQDCMREVNKTFFDLNLDFNIVNLKDVKNRYRILILPSHIVMTKEEAAYIRSYVEEGGTVIMTAYSAMLDGNGQAFSVTRPGLVDDVFGIRLGGYERDKDGTYTEEIILRGASAFETGENGECLVSCSRYGLGRAYYCAHAMNHEEMEALLCRIAPEAGIAVPDALPAGVQMREIAPGRFFYVNTTDREIPVALPGAGRFVLQERDAEGTQTLKPFDADLFVMADCH